MKIQKFITLFLILFSFQSFAQTNTGDTVGKLPGPENQQVSFDELLKILGRKIYIVDSKCSEAKNRKITNTDFWESYTTLLAFYMQKEESLQPKNSSCNENCKAGPDKVDKYFSCLLLNIQGIDKDMRFIIEWIDLKNEKDKSYTDKQMREFFTKLLKIVEK